MTQEAPQKSPKANPVEYKVVDTQWSPSDPSASETMLNELGQDGWQLSAVYPDPIREKTRWVFIR